MNDNRQSSNIKNVPQNRPYVTNRKFLHNIQKFNRQQYKPKPNFQPRPIKRSSSTDNFKQQPKQPIKQEEKKPESKDDTNVKELIGTTVGIMDKKLVEFTAKVNSLIELKTKYYVDQRINVLENSNDLLTRGANELAIQADPTNAGNSFQFKYNGDSVARITDSGVLYCRNLWVNGLNIISTLNSMMATEQDTAEVIGDYVKRIELKNGTFELDVKSMLSDTVNINSSTTNTPLTIDSSYSPQFVNVSIGGISNAIQVDKYNDSTSIMDMIECVNWGSQWMSFINFKSHINNFLSYYLGNPSITENQIVFGYEDNEGDSVLFKWNH